MKINATKLLVEDIVETTNQTKSGILIPTEVVKKDSMKAKVIVVGEGTDDIKIPYSVGETVLIHPRAGSKFHYEDKEYRLVDVADIFLGGIV